MKVGEDDPATVAITRDGTSRASYKVTLLPSFDQPSHSKRSTSPMEEDEIEEEELDDYINYIICKNERTLRCIHSPWWRSIIYDFIRALTEGPWMVMDHYIIIHQWVPNFIPRENIISTIPMWIRLPKIPLEFYDDKMLERIGNALGKFIKTNSYTTHVARGKFARINIEVDLLQPLVPTLFVQDMEVSMVYEGLHNVCFGCGRFRHMQTDCSNETLDKLMKEGRAPMEKGEEAHVEVHFQDMSHPPRPPPSDASLHAKEAPSFRPWTFGRCRQRPCLIDIGELGTPGAQQRWSNELLLGSAGRSCNSKAEGSH
ncbi:hypothetical protein Syun_022801 [Stephania yunnanensis]|uniref:CCHC-type domain-containing protein n=1 Tax=Stephania yunnanensis TaxID=152371 RepID=A0AAP0FA58_9MAGN